MTKDKALQKARDALEDFTSNEKETNPVLKDRNQMPVSVETYKTIKTALRVLEAEIEGGWQTMESAPHGVWIMIHAYGNWHQACWNANGWWDTYRDNRIMLHVPDYWKPLESQAEKLVQDFIEGLDEQQGGKK
jgi:hypothetical protein